MNTQTHSESQPKPYEGPSHVTLLVTDHNELKQLISLMLREMRRLSAEYAYFVEQDQFVFDDITTVNFEEAAIQRWRAELTLQLKEIYNESPPNA